jgi:hypothetical protein
MKSYCTTKPSVNLYCTSEGHCKLKWLTPTEDPDQLLLNSQTHSRDPIDSFPLSKNSQQLFELSFKNSIHSHVL